MTPERNQTSEKFQEIRPLLRQVIADLSTDLDLENPNPIISDENHQTVEEFRILSFLALTAGEVTPEEHEKWMEKVSDERDYLVGHMLGLNKVGYALDIDMIYLNFLTESGAYDLAIDHARKVASGYVEDGIEIQFSESAGRKRDKVLSRVSGMLASVGQVDRAAQIFEELSFSLENRGYYEGILQYYSQEKNLDALYRLVTLAKRHRDSNQYSENVDYTRFIENYMNQAHHEISKIYVLQGDDINARRHINSITVPTYRIRVLTKFVDSLLERNQTNRARNVAYEIIEYVAVNTSVDPDEEDDDEEDQPYGSLAFLKVGKEKVEPSSDVLRNYDRSDILLTLAQALSEDETCIDLFHECIRKAEYSIALATGRAQPSLWGTLIKTIGCIDDVDLLDKYYQKGRLHYPNSEDFFREMHAVALVGTNPNKAVNTALGIQDKNQAITCYADLTWLIIEMYGFGDWEDNVSRLLVYEKSILPTGNETSALTTLLNIAKLAVHDGEIEIFEKIVQHYHLSAPYKVHLLYDVVRWYKGKSNLIYY